MLWFLLCYFTLFLLAFQFVFQIHSQKYTFFRNKFRNFESKAFFPIFAESLTKTFNIMQLLTIGWPEILLIVLIVLLLFGAKKIPELMKGMGKGVKSFKDGLNGVDEPEIKEDKEKKE